MVKVQCKICGDIGYTASPRFLVCKCGGRFKVIPENRQKRELESAFLKSVFTLEILPIQCIYFILRFKKLALLTSAGYGGLREVKALRVRKLSRVTKWVARLLFFLGRPSEKEAKPQFPKSLAGDSRPPEIISRQDKFDK